MIASVLNGDALDTLRQMPDECVQVCVTSPPYYGLRDYGHEGQIGAEPTPQAYVEKIVEVFREVRRVLKEDGTLWLNLGDSYGKFKQLMGMPWRVAFALQADGWFLRQDIIWHKPNPMPESVRDRCTKAHEYVFLMSKSSKYRFDADAIREESKRPWNSNYFSEQGQAKRSSGIKGHRNGAGSRPEGMQTGRNRRSVWHVENEHEYVFLLAKSSKYKFDADAIKTPMADSTSKRWNGGAKKPTGKEAKKYAQPQEKMFATKLNLAKIGAKDMCNKRSVWTITPKPFRGAHFAVMPPALVEPCVLAGSSEGDIVLDPFNGAGTTGLVALQHGRHYVGIELNAEYITLTGQRFKEAGFELT